MTDFKLEYRLSPDNSVWDISNSRRSFTPREQRTAQMPAAEARRVNARFGHTIVKSTDGSSVEPTAADIKRAEYLPARFPSGEEQSIRRTSTDTDSTTKKEPVLVQEPQQPGQHGNLPGDYGPVI